jgi:PAP2 superfamily
LYLRSHPIYKIIVPLFAATLFSSSASCQTDSFEALPPLPSPVEHTLRIPAAGNFDITTLRLRTFAPDSTRERWAEGNPPPERWRYEFPAGTSQQSQTQKQEIDQHGLVMRAVKRTWQDQKELYLTPFKPSNFKWDALVLAGTAGLLATDRRIETHIGRSNISVYQATSDVAIGGLGATLAGVWALGIKGNHPHAKETGVLELETLVNTFLIYTPMQLVAARQRPDEGNGYGDFWKHHNINTSFPGGHAMFTFAMATVVSHEYSQKWVQALAYSAASIVTVSRFMARDHWSSDMLVGSALGIGIGSHIFHAHCNPDLSDSCKHHVRWIF